MITLKTLSQATKQQVFNQIAKHLLTQGKKSIDGMDCRYRNREGLKCAAGCLIADDEYSEKFEGGSWVAIVNDYLLPQAHKNLIFSLQYIHDMKPSSDWNSELTKIANRNNLVYENEHYRK